MLQMQAQQLQLTTQIHLQCFNTCIPVGDKPGSKSIGNGGDARAEACFKNCVGRFIDASKVVYSKWSQVTHRAAPVTHRNPCVVRALGGSSLSFFFGRATRRARAVGRKRKERGKRGKGHGEKE